MEAAGGIGGLLAVCDPNDPCDPADTAGDFVYTYDANGNVGQLIDGTPTSWNASTAMVARYEYDPYGKVTQSAGSYAAANPFRFSTKWFDAETGFGYWGERYYWPELGRWLNRDPIEEAGGVNLYGYVGNAPVGRLDALGHGVLCLLKCTIDCWECWVVMNCYADAGNYCGHPQRMVECEEECALTGKSTYECYIECLRKWKPPAADGLGKGAGNREGWTRCMKSKLAECLDDEDPEDFEDCADCVICLLQCSHGIKKPKWLPLPDDWVDDDVDDLIGDDEKNSDDEDDDDEGADVACPRELAR